MAEPALAPSIGPPPGQAPPLRVVPPPVSAANVVSPRLEIPAYDLSAALNLERELGVGHVLAQVLVRRGLRDPTAARAFLEAAEQHPPEAFDGIERACEVIGRHVRAGSRITVHGDYDVDGVCATAIMVRALRSLGATADWFLPDRIEDGYGLAGDTVARLAARGCGLLITVDCAITAVDEVAAARAAGLEVVVSDHHHPRPDGLLPECPVVHPGVCGYPCPELCGTGVAFKLAQALGAPSAEEDLELVALATVADLMPLRGENRRLVRAGLAAMAGTARPGLRALMEVAGVDPSALDASALGFRLAPRINAAGRLSRADAGLELLLTENAGRAKEIALELDQLNTERRAVEQRITWEAEAQVAELGERIGYVLAGEDWHPGVIGIVASRIAERHHRPAVLVALDESGGTGSGRSIPGFDLLGALHACAGHLERYGGHQAAAGLTVSRENLTAFAEAFDAHARTTLPAELLVPRETIDAIVSGSELGLGLAEELERLEPCGMGNRSARLLVPGARLGECRPMGESGRHARFVVMAGGTRTPAVAFGCDGRLPVTPEEPADATFRLERNCWNGTVAPRLVMRHARRCEPEPIRVLGEPDDYLQTVLEELARPFGVPAAGPRPGVRTRLDRRGESPLVVLGDALATGGEVLAVCAEVRRRLGGLSARTGGFSLISYHTLECEPDVLDGFAHVIALDPPGCETQAGLIARGAGFTHLAWWKAELRFAQHMHELEYSLRTSLVSLYRGLRPRGKVAGGELERLLRGDEAPGRPARLAARLVKVLSELELVVLDPRLPALSIAGEARTALERSAAYRAYAKRHEDGRRYLSSATLLPSG